MTDQPCPFCEIIAYRAPATIVRVWPDALAIVPLGPVVDGHLLVIPHDHVSDFSADPDVTAITARRAAELALERGLICANLITSMGAAATQSVFHLHLHLVPRAENDGLALPWYSGKKKSGLQINVRPKPNDDDAFARGFAAGRRTR
jgi:histidine triad (HIT) family protein